MINLNRALASLNLSVPVGWTTPFLGLINIANSHEANNNILLVNLTTILEPATTNLFNDLNKSVIEGEYAFDTQAARVVLQNIEDYISAQAIFIFHGFPESTAFAQDYYTEKFLSTIRKGITDYKKLLEVVDSYLNFEPHVNTLFNQQTKDVPISENIRPDALLFKLNIQVARIDHTLSFNNSTFEKLITISHRLSDIASRGSISDILKKKCDFLISKLTHRVDGNKTIKYAIDFKHHVLTIAIPPELEYYEEIINGNYDEIYTNKFRNRYKNALSKYDVNPSTLSLDNYHALIKYFKDISPSLTKLQHLKVQFESFYNSSSSVSKFDVKTRETAYCYLENNIFSLELDRDQINLNNWRQSFNNYTTRAKNLKNSNFFPYFKIINEFLSPEIGRQFESSDINFNIIKILIKEYEKNLQTFSENLNVCKQTNYYPYQLGFDECRTRITDIYGDTWECFIASSFVLPLNYEDWYRKLDLLNAGLVKYKALLDLRVSLKEDIKEIYEAKDKLAESDKRHIEILSIFAAIVLFVSNEIQLFTKLTSIKDAVAFTLFFAYALGLFVMLIWFVTRPKNVSFKRLPATHWVLIAVFSGGFLLAATYLYGTSDDSILKHENKGNIDEKIDSLKKIIELDSLQKVHIKFRKHS